MPGKSLAAAALCIGMLSLGARAKDVQLDGKTFHLPEGFTIQKVAAPPLINRPVTADFDEQGRLYVSDVTGTPDNLQKQLKNPPHRILRLEDSDGDGQFDRQEVFAEHVMFPEGTLWYDGALYVSGVPSIWKITPAGRDEWFAGKTMTGCGNDLHGPYLGPDGWIYWCKGAFATQTYERPGHKPFVTRAAHIFRARPDGSGIEPVMTGGMDNPVELAFTPGGERIFTTTFLVNPANGQRDGIIHAVYGGIYGKIHDVIDDHPHTFPEVMPVLVHTGPAAQCALMRYESDVFGPQYQDNLFASSFNLHKVTRHILTPEGATFSSTNEDFLTCDSFDFHPTHLIEDADGSLLVIDTGGWYKLCCPTSQLGKPDVLGAIYRIRKAGAKALDDPRGLKLAWDQMNAPTLAGFLDDPRPAVRKRAIAALGKSKAVDALQGVLEHSKTQLARINAVWALTRVDGPEARAAVRKALADPDEVVRQVAAHSTSLWRDRDAFSPLVALLHGSSSQNRRVAAEALGRIEDPQAVPELLWALETPGDHVLEHSLTYALIEINAPDPTAAGLTSSNPHVRRAAMMALDQMESGGHLPPQVVATAILSDDPALRDSAGWIAGHHSEWGDALASALGQRAQIVSNPADASALRQQLSRLSSSASIQKLIARRLTSSSATPTEKTLMLGAMADSGLKPVPAEWADALQKTLASPDVGILNAAVNAVRRLPLGKSASSFSPLLLNLASNAQLPPTLRLEALSAINGSISDAPPELFSFMLSQLQPNQPIAQRILAAEALGRARLSSGQLQELAKSITTAGPLEINKLLAAYAQASDDPTGLALVAALKEAKAAKALRVDAIRPNLRKFGPTVLRQAEQLYTQLEPDLAGQKAHLDDLLAKLPSGDIRRGQAIFNSQKIACAQCHAIGYVGGHVGPDLTRIGSVRAERDLLESIVFPSASFVQSFEPMTAITKGNERYDGVLRRNDSTEVLLITGPTQEVHIPRGELKELRPGTLSVMPAGLEDQLSKQDLADLVAFLKACR